MRRRRPVRPCGALLLMLLLAACGDDPAPAPHGLGTTLPESRPEGEAVDVGFDVADGDVFVGTFAYSTRLWQRHQAGGEPEVKQASASMTFEVEQIFHRPGADRNPHSTLRLRYVEAEGGVAEALLAREPLTGAVEHERSGRAVTASLRLDGGTAPERAEALGLLGGLPLAGFAGSPSWLPDRPVRKGEVWRIEGFLRPRGMDAAVRQARTVGMQAPTPTLSGTIRVLSIRDGAQGPEVELEIDSLIELEGPIRQGDERGHMSLGHKVAGTAVVSARTGLPLRLDVTETQHNNVRSGPQRVERRLTNHFEGSIRRKD